MSEPTKLEAGMLLLDPEHKVVYTVVSAKTIIAHHGNVSERATLTMSGVPEGWRVINNRALALDLIDRCETTSRSLASTPRPLSTETPGGVSRPHHTKGTTE